MRIHQHSWKYFQQHSVVSFVGKLSTSLLFGLLLLGLASSTVMGMSQAQAKSGCPDGDQAHRIGKADRIRDLANHFGANWDYHHLANPNFIYVNRVICIHMLVKASSSSPPSAPASSGSHSNPPAATPPPHPTPAPGGSGNVFPYGTCTWWGDQRYYQLHGIFVPWRTQANAWEWTARAYQFGWRVSSAPIYGAIINLQPGVQGASGLGHVAVVERILSNGHVIASNMAWGAYPLQVTYVEFVPGPGVTFLIQ